MSGQPNIPIDVATILIIPNKVTAELVDKANLCIGSTISDAKLAGEQAVIINIGIGTLSVDLIDMNCKFVPSKDLKAAIKAGLSGDGDPLELALEATLAEKLAAVVDEVI